MAAASVVRDLLSHGTVLAHRKVFDIREPKSIFCSFGPLEPQDRSTCLMGDLCGRDKV